MAEFKQAFPKLQAGETVSVQVGENRANGGGANESLPFIGAGAGIGGGGGAGILLWPEVPQPSLSFIESHEEAEARALIDKQFTEMCGKAFTGRAAGYMVVVKIYIREEKTDGGIVMPDTVRAEDRFSSAVGLIVSMGPGCFKNRDGSARYHGPTPAKVGDWIIFPRGDIVRVDYRGVALGLMTDDKILMVIDEPKDFVVGHLTVNQ